MKSSLRNPIPFKYIHVKFYKFYLVFLYNCGVECCIIIYCLCFNGLCKVMGVVVSFLNDGKRLNLNNYGLGFLSNLQEVSLLITFCTFFFIVRLSLRFNRTLTSSTIFLAIVFLNLNSSTKFQSQFKNNNHLLELF